MERICKNCSKPFKVSGNAWNKLFCTKACRVEYVGFKGAYKGISAASVGAIAELAVSADLLKKGYAVFRSVSPSCSCDLIAMKGKKVLRVEVKSGYQNKDGRIQCAKPKQVNYDILAIVLHQKDTIIYKPTL